MQDVMYVSSCKWKASKWLNQRDQCYSSEQLPKTRNRNLWCLKVPWMKWPFHPYLLDRDEEWRQYNKHFPLFMQCTFCSLIFIYIPIQQKVTPFTSIMDRGQWLCGHLDYIQCNPTNFWWGLVAITYLIHENDSKD